MSFRGLLNQPLVIHHRGPTEPPTTDDYGNEVLAETGTTPVDGYVEQIDAQEITVDRETYTANWLIRIPWPSSMTGRDWVEHGAHHLEVIGDPYEVYNPRTRRYHHVQLKAREVTG